MQHKIVLDLDRNNNYSDLDVRLTGIDKEKIDMELSLSKAIEKGYIALEKKEFLIAKEYLKLCINLSNYGNKKVEEFEDLLNGQEIIFNYNNGKINFYEKVKILVDIEKFRKIYFSHLYNSQKMDSVFANIELIKKNICSEIESTDVYINENYINEAFCFFKNISQLSKRSINEKSMMNLSELSINIKKSIDSIISKSNEKELLSFIKKIYIKEFEEDFFQSKEFYEIPKNDLFSKIENYYDLFRLVEESYLLYKISKSKDEKEVISIIASLNIISFLELPYIKKQYVVEEFINNKVYFNNISELIKIIKERVKEVKRVTIPLDRAKFVDSNNIKLVLERERSDFYNELLSKEFEVVLKKISSKCGSLNIEKSYFCINGNKLNIGLYIINNSEKQIILKSLPIECCINNYINKNITLNIDKNISQYSAVFVELIIELEENEIEVEDIDVFINDNKVVKKYPYIDIDIDIKNMPKVSQYKSYRMVKNKIKNIPIAKLDEVKIDIINVVNDINGLSILTLMRNSCEKDINIKSLPIEVYNELGLLIYKGIYSNENGIKIKNKTGIINCITIPWNEFITVKAKEIRDFKVKFVE